MIPLVNGIVRNLFEAGLMPSELGKMTFRELHYWHDLKFPIENGDAR